MSLIPMRPILDAAAAGNYGVGAFNANNLEQIQAVMGAADITGSPVIIQASLSARAYAGDRFLYGLIQAATEIYPHIPVALHLDHGSSPEACFSAIDAGFTSVMMDGSLEADGKTPASYEYNLAVTREVVEYAHARGVSVEGELGTLGGVEDGHGSGEVHLTDPAQAEEFVAATGIDALAVAIGTSHGAYKFTSKPTEEVLAMSLIEEINRRLPSSHLVMHGSSSVPEDLIERFNAAGGQLKPAFGVPLEEIQQGIRNGVRKINVDTDGRLALTAAIRQSLQEDPALFDPRKYLGAGRAALQEIVAERMRSFGQAGQAEGVLPLSMEQMAERYAREQARV